MAVNVEPFPFAELEDLRKRWPGFPEELKDTAEVFLEDASQFILDTVPTAANASENTRRRIVCAVVKRAMTALQEDAAGVESFSESTGPFSDSWKPVNPNGDFYLTRAEKQALGEGKQVAFGRDVTGGGPHVEHRPWCALMWNANYCSCGADIAGGPVYEA